MQSTLNMRFRAYFFLSLLMCGFYSSTGFIIGVHCYWVLGINSQRLHINRRFNIRWVELLIRSISNLSKWIMLNSVIFPLWVHLCSNHAFSWSINSWLFVVTNLWNHSPFGNVVAGSRWRKWPKTLLIISFCGIEVLYPIEFIIR